MDKVLKIGIIGCGAIGKDHCRRIIETVPGATVVAVSDYVAAAADETAAKYGIRSFGNDCDAMIKDPEVEAVVITSIDPTHHDYVMKVLAEKKWCFCEKPLSQNAKDCEEITELLTVTGTGGDNHFEVPAPVMLSTMTASTPLVQMAEQYSPLPDSCKGPPRPDLLKLCVLRV